MSLLSDKSINARCVVPDRIFDQAYYDVLLTSQNQKGWPLTDAAIHNLRAELREQAMREPTAEEQRDFKPMIAPYHSRLLREVPVGPNGEMLKIISKGQSSYGYDVTLSPELRLFTNAFSRIINPKKVDVEKCTVAMEVHEDPEFGRYVIMPPNSYALGRTVEYFHMPRDVTVVCLGKSTYARVGVAVNVTPIEAGWHGNVVLEFANNTNSPVMLFVCEGVAQFLFLQGDQECEVSYEDRGGKYQGQTGNHPRKGVIVNYFGKRTLEPQSHSVEDRHMHGNEIIVTHVAPIEVGRDLGLLNVNGDGDQALYDHGVFTMTDHLDIRLVTHVLDVDDVLHNVLAGSVFNRGRQHTHVASRALAGDDLLRLDVFIEHSTGSITSTGNERVKGFILGGGRYDSNNPRQNSGDLLSLGKQKVGRKPKVKES